MIPGRFRNSYSFHLPYKNRLLIVSYRYFKTFPFQMRHSFLGRYIESDSFIHFLDIFTKTKEVDPFDDSRLRYVVRIYKYDEKRKQIVPTRAAASTTLRGAQKLARELSAETGLPFLQDHGNLREFIMIWGYRAYVDYEKARVRSWSRKRSGG